MTGLGTEPEHNGRKGRGVAQFQGSGQVRLKGKTFGWRGCTNVWTEGTIWLDAKRGRNGVKDAKTGEATADRGTSIDTKIELFRDHS
jgi:hypothetical protein